MTHLLLSLVLTVSVQDQLDGAQIGDAIQALTFATGGAYSAEHKEKTGKTVARGRWKVVGNSLEVTVSSCKGPSCKSYGQGYKSEVAVVGDRAMTVNTTPIEAPLASGSYYCHYQGCEKRIGVEVTGHAASAPALRHTLDFLVEKNHGRNVTVVWWAERLSTPLAATRVTYCRRDEARAKAAAQAVADDLAELPWLGSVTVQPGEASCFYDVRVEVGDAIAPPSP